MSVLRSSLCFAEVVGLEAGAVDTMKEELDSTCLEKLGEKTSNWQAKHTWISSLFYFMACTLLQHHHQSRGTYPDPNTSCQSLTDL